jgi:hypothetical protein
VRSVAKGTLRGATPASRARALFTTFTLLCSQNTVQLMTPSMISMLMMHSQSDTS